MSQEIIGICEECGQTTYIQLIDGRYICADCNDEEYEDGEVNW